MILETLRAAWAAIRARPRQFVLTALCVAVGVAASGAVLTLVYAIQLRPLPFPNGERLVRVWVDNGSDPRIDLSIPELADLENGVAAFDAFAGTARMRLTALFQSGAMRLRGEAVTPRYFELLGMRPQLGRVFEARDFAADAVPVTLLSDAVWRSRFGARIEAIGEVVRSASGNLEVIGVLPAGFTGTVEDDEVEFWVPLPQYRPAARAVERGVRMAWAIGRLAPGVSLPQASAQVDAVGAALAAAHPDEYARFTWRVEAFGENWRGPLRGSTWMLLGAALLLLAIAVVNVSGLALARALDRRREFAVRAAIGGGIGRLALLAGTETALAAAAGGLLGTLATPWLLRACLALAPVAIPEYLELHPDPTLLAALAGICLLAATAAGLLPALEAGRADPQEALRDAGRTAAPGRGTLRAGRWLVLGQLALTMLLLVNASLLTRSYLSIGATDLGFRTDIARFALTLNAQDTGPDALAFSKRLSAELRAEPGVRSVGLMWPTLPPWDAYRPAFHHTAMGGEPDAEGPRMGVHAIDTELLGTMDIALLDGRAIEAQDGPEQAPVALVSRSLALRLGGIERVLGTELVNAFSESPVPERARIVGVVEDVGWDGIGEQDTGRLIRWNDLQEPGATRFDAYYALAQMASGRANPLSIAVLPEGDPALAMAPLRRRLARMAPQSAVHWDSTMKEELAGEVRTSNFAMVLTVAFGAAALLLSATGLFAVLSQAVARRTVDFGVRFALGATPAQVLRQVLGSGATLSAAGILIGAIAAAGAARLLGGLLYGIAPFDPAAYLASAVLLLMVGLFACALPARRAARVDPMEALRGD